MPVNLVIDTGDGVNTPRVTAVLSLPDSGTSLSIQGTVQAPGKPAVPITGSPLAIPGPPVNLTMWNLQVNLQTGAAQVLSPSLPPVNSVNTAGPLFPLLVGQQMGSPTDPGVLAEVDPPPAETGPKAPLLPFGSLMVSPNKAPINGRAPTPADAGDTIVIFRQTLQAASPAAAWANTSNQVPPLF